MSQRVDDGELDAGQTVPQQVDGAGHVAVVADISKLAVYVELRVRACTPQAVSPVESS